MKVIFLKDVQRVGRKGEVKEVADGFAHNSLFPRKLAVPATHEHVKRAEDERARKATDHAEKGRQLKEIEKKSAETPIVITASVNDKGHLFKAIRTFDIVEALKKTYGLSLEERDVVLAHPIKETGVHTIGLSYGGMSGACTVSVQGA